MTNEPLPQYIALIHCMNLQKLYLLESEMGKTITVKVLVCSSYLGFVSNLFSHERVSKLDTCPSVETYFRRVPSLATINQPQEKASALFHGQPGVASGVARYRSSFATDRDLL